jgi:hypothetical protein
MGSPGAQSVRGGKDEAIGRRRKSAATHGGLIQVRKNHLKIVKKQV